MVRLLLVVAMVFAASGCEYIRTLPKGGDGGGVQRVQPPQPKLP